MFLHVLLLALFLICGCSTSQNDKVLNVTEKLEKLGMSHSEHYTQPDEIYARNIWDLQAFDGKLYIGAGNSSNKGPAQNAGPVPVICWNPTKKSFQQEFIVDDEQIDQFYIFNDELFIPGHDPRQSWKLGNVYRKKKGQNWQKVRNVPGAIHTYAMHLSQNTLFAGLGAIKAVPEYKQYQGAGSAVAISHDNGKSWKNSNTGGFRIHGFLEADGVILATDVVVGPEFKVHTDKLKRTDLYAPAYEYNGKDGFVRRTDISAKELFPGVNFQQFFQAKTVKPQKWKSGTVYIGGYCHNDHQFFPFGLYHAENLKKGSVKISSVPIPQNSLIWDLLIKDDAIFILISSQLGELHRVTVLKSHNLKNWQEVLNFESPAFARSFEFLNGDLYFGLGCELMNPSRWSQKELVYPTGILMKISKENIP